MSHRLDSAFRILDCARRSDQIFMIAENSQSVISTLSATHSLGQNLTFAIDASKHNGANFTIDGNSLKARGSGLDYEQDNYQQVEFVVTDEDGYLTVEHFEVGCEKIDEEI